MNDIKKMREEFEQKVKYAQIENDFNEELEANGIHADVYGKDLIQKDKISVGFRTTGGRITQDEVCHLLNKFEPSEPIKVYCGQEEGYRDLPYEMETHRSPNEHGTTLRIGWVFGVFRMHLHVNVEECSEDIKSMFRQTHRRLVESEISAYGIQKTRWNVDYRECFPFMTFDGGKVVKFEGGYCRQVSEDYLTYVADAFKAME